MKHGLSSLRAFLQKTLCCQIPLRFWSGVRYPHPIGIVIGDGVRIGKGVRIYQNVSIGLHANMAGATPSDYPTLGDNVFVYAGAVIIGGITIGRDSIVAANAIVSRDVPPDSIAFGYNQFKPKRRDTSSQVE